MAADVGTNRRRVWRKTGRKDSEGRDIIEDMEYDLVMTPSGKEVFVPFSGSTRAKTRDGSTVESDYVGFVVLGDNDPNLVTPFGTGFGGMRRIA